MNVQKLAHNRNQDEKGEPIKHFVKLPLWWAGILMNVFGELGNMFAYGFAPVSLVAPVGSVDVFVNEVIAVLFLKEPFRIRDGVGLVGVVAGVVLIILGVPESEAELDVHTLLSDQYFNTPRVWAYAALLLLGIALFVFVLEPRYARQNILVWLLLCSVISSVTVIACRSFASLVALLPADCGGDDAQRCHHGLVHAPCTGTLGHWLMWVLLLILVVTAIWSANYLQKAMMVYGNTEVVPVYYCTFTLAAIVGGGVVYNDFANVTPGLGVMFGCGVVAALGSVWLITGNRDKVHAYTKDDAEAYGTRPLSLPAPPCPRPSVAVGLSLPSLLSPPHDSQSGRPRPLPLPARRPMASAHR